MFNSINTSRATQEASLESGTAHQRPVSRDEGSDAVEELAALSESRQQDGTRGSPRMSLLRSLLRDRAMAIGLGLLLGMGLVAIFASRVVPHDPALVNLGSRQVPPFWSESGSWAYPLGTDSLGRDVLSRTIAGSRASLLVGTAVVLISGSFGTVMGLLAGLRGGWTDQLIARAVDAQMAFPGILLVVLVAGALGPSVGVVVAVLCIFGWLLFARIVRSSVFQLKESGFVVAAELVGCSQLRIMRRHLFPNLLAPVATVAMLQFAVAVLLEAGLSYLGLGLQPPSISWGLMIAENQQYLATAWWSVVVPGLWLALTVLLLNSLAASLQVRFDPHQQALARAARAAREARSTADGFRGDTFEDARVPAETSAGLEPVAAREVGGEGLPSGEIPAPLLQIRGLSVSFATERGSIEVLHDVDLEVDAGTTLGLVGESGSGKSLTAASVLGLLPAGGAQTRGGIYWEGRPLDGRRLKEIRGSEVTLINQEPVSTLDPLMTVGRQLVEVLQRHRPMGRRAAESRAKELFELVGIPEPGRRVDQYPWEFSGGMAQRVVIAMGLAPEPKLLIADEPTTAVDVTIQAQVMRVINDVQREFGLSMILITHDLGVVCGVADRIAVMYAGRIVESGTTSVIFGAPQHPYTRGLMAATPDPRDGRGDTLDSIPGNPPENFLGPGCPFSPRCDSSTDICTTDRPELERIGANGPTNPAEPGAESPQLVACWHAEAGTS